MPGMLTDGGGPIVPFSGEPDNVAPDLPVRPIRHGVAPPIFRVYVSWSSGNLLQVACLSPPNPEDDGGRGASEVAGRVVEVNLGVGVGVGVGSGSAEVEEEVDEAEMRRIEYGSVPAFALLQSRKNALADAAAMPRMHSVSEHAEWWQYVLEYSKTIANLLGNPDSIPALTNKDPRAILKVKEKPTSLKAAWELLEILYVDKQLRSWLPERLIDWLADYEILLTKTDDTVYGRLSNFQKKLINLQIVEDDPDYWNGLSAALSVGWLDAGLALGGRGEGGCAAAAGPQIPGAPPQVCRMPVAKGQGLLAAQQRSSSSKSRTTRRSRMRSSSNLCRTQQLASWASGRRPNAVTPRLIPVVLVSPRAPKISGPALARCCGEYATFS